MVSAQHLRDGGEQVFALEPTGRPAGSRIPMIRSPSRRA